MHPKDELHRHFSLIIPKISATFGGGIGLEYFGDMRLCNHHAFTEGFLGGFSLCFPDYGKGKFESGTGTF